MRSLWTSIAAAAVASVLAVAAPAAAETVEVTFIVANDTDRLASDAPRGGFARLAALVKKERSERDHVVYAFGGDALSPSLLSGFDQGAHIVTLLNMAPPDVFVPGNHEFDFGPEIFAKRMGEAAFPRLAANLRDADDRPLEGIDDTRMIEAGGVKIGIVGLTADDSAVKSSPGDLKIAPTVDTGLAQAERLRDAGADLVVAVTHANRATDRRLLDSRAFDLVLSGDDHDLTVVYDGRGVLLESREQAEHVAIADITIEIGEKDGERRVEWSPRLRVVDTAAIAPDPEVLAQIKAFEGQLSKELDVVIGRTRTELDSRRPAVRGGEAAIGNLVADAMRAAVDAEVAVTNGGGIRGDKVYPAGSEITRRDVLTELPFGNRTVKLEVTGATLLAALENGLSKVEEGSGRFPQVSGLTVGADLSKPAGSRVVSVAVGGAPLDPSKTYTLATNDFMARGGDGYTMLRDARRILDERDAKLMANDVMVHIRERGEIAAAPEGRIRTGG